MKDLVIRVPESIKEEFINFLDVAQASFTEEDVVNFSKNEREVLKFVEKVIGECSSRYPNKQAKVDAANGLMRILSQV